MLQFSGTVLLHSQASANLRQWSLLSGQVSHPWVDSTHSNPPEWQVRWQPRQSWSQKQSSQSRNFKSWSILFILYIYIHKIKHKYRWRLISWYHDITYPTLYLVFVFACLPEVKRSKAWKKTRFYTWWKAYKNTCSLHFFTVRCEDREIGVTAASVLWLKLLKLIWLRKPNDCSQTFVSLFNSHIFSPNSVCCLGVFSYSKGPGSKWDICLLEFFGANGFHL